jgi:hypothetical protein
VSPITHKQPAPDPLFLEPKDHNKETTERDTLYVSFTPSISAVMALNRRVLKEGDILCELYADICSDVSDNSEGEFLDSDSISDVPTASSHKQFQLPSVVLTSDGDTNTEEEENSELESCDVWCETNKKPSSGPFLGTSGVNIVELSKH